MKSGRLLMNKIFDMETHIHPPSLLKYLQGNTEYPFFDSKNNILHLNESMKIKDSFILQHLDDSIKERISLMDRLGISASILSVAQGWEDISDAKTAIKLTREINNYIYEATQEYCGRFFGSVFLQIVDVPEAVKELERCVNELGFIGWTTYSNFGNKRLSDPCYLPLLEKACELGIFVNIHSSKLPAKGRAATLGEQLFPLGYGIDISLTLLRLICDGVFDKYEDLKIVIGHLGETLPAVGEFIDGIMDSGQFQILPAKNKYPIKYYLKKNVYYLTGGSISSAVFQMIKDSFGIDRILFSTDYPFDTFETMEKLFDDYKLCEKDMRKILFENAMGLIHSREEVKNGNL